MACNPQRDNPDWISQSANSFRELLYPIWLTVKTPSKKDKLAAIKEKFRSYGSIHIENVFDEVCELYGQLNDLTHHGVDPRTFNEDELHSLNANEFRNLIRRFEYLMHKALTLSLHALDQINSLLQKEPETPENQVILKR